MSLPPADMEFARSLELYEKASAVISGGVNSNVRFWERPHPLFFVSGEGPYIFDVDGNRLIDYVLGQGPLLIGHRPPAVLEAVMRQLDQGILYGAQHEAEIETAQLIIDMVPSAEVIRFNMTGTEAVQAALRIARAATGRDRVVKFEGHYHGWADSVLFNVGSQSGPRSDGDGILPVPESAGIAEGAGEPLLVAPWNDVVALEKIVQPNSDSIAAVIMEPIMANSSVIVPQDGYLSAVRELCDRYGIVLIFDEVITGFRVHSGGAQARYGVSPDLTVLGKALASGFAIGCVAGRAQLFDGVKRGDVNHSGTFNANPISIVAARATLRALQSGGASWYSSLETRGSRLMEGLSDLLTNHGIQHLVQGLPSVFNIMFTDMPAVRNHQEASSADQAHLEEFLERVVGRGVRFAGHGNVYMCDGHTDGVIDETLERVEEAVATLARSNERASR